MILVFHGLYDSVCAITCQGYIVPQAERQNGHGDAQDREPAAKLVVKGISKEDFELEHRSDILCPKASQSLPAWPPGDHG